MKSLNLAHAAKPLNAMNVNNFMNSRKRYLNICGSDLGKEPAKIPQVPACLKQQVRSKTYTRPVTKQRRKHVAEQMYRKAVGMDPLPPPPVEMENRFYQIVDGMKIYKAVTPGLRNRRHPTRFHLYKGPAVRRLSVGKRSTGGRNCHGRIVARHRGGGHKKRIRLIDFKRATPGEYQVI